MTICSEVLRWLTLPFLLPLDLAVVGERLGECGPGGHALGDRADALPVVQHQHGPLCRAAGHRHARLHGGPALQVRGVHFSA